MEGLVIARRRRTAAGNYRRNWKSTHLIDWDRDWRADRKSGQREPRDAPDRRRGAGGNLAGNRRPEIGRKSAGRRAGKRSGRRDQRFRPYAGQWEKGERVPTRTTHRRTVQYRLGGGEGGLPNSKIRGRFGLSLGNGLARPDQYGQSSDRAISGEGRNSHERYAFLVGNGNGRANGGPENGHIKINISYIWRGEPPGGLPPSG